MLSKVLLIVIFSCSGISRGAQFLALTNFEVPTSFFKSPSLGTIVYSKINSAVSPNESALSNPFVLWINVSIKIAAPHSDTVEHALYSKIIKSSFIISIIPLIRFFSSFIAAITCLNNATVLEV